jgi:hypothetical protein
MVWAVKNSDLSEGRLLAALAKVAWGAWGVGLLVGLKEYAVDGRAITWSSICDALATSIVFMQFTHLCALWLWINWVMYHAGTKVIREARAGVGTGPAVLRLLKRMKQASSLWGSNHAVRLFTTTAAATAELGVAEYWRALSVGKYGHLQGLEENSNT